MAFDTPDLTFIYISFAKIFCQNLVKKNCKYIFRFSVKNGDARWRKGTRMFYRTGLNDGPRLQ